MTVEAFYRQLGGDYNAVLARIPSEALIRKFAEAFVKDPSFNLLCSAIDSNHRENAFRAAHTLKGVCANLGYENLRLSASELTETLRAENVDIPEKAIPQIQAVKRDYQTVINAISKFIG